MEYGDVAVANYPFGVLAENLHIQIFDGVHGAISSADGDNSLHLWVQNHFGELLRTEFMWACKVVMNLVGKMFTDFHFQPPTFKLLFPVGGELLLRR